jgi:ketosteroid isomerase-like protein
MSFSVSFAMAHEDTERAQRTGMSCGFRGGICEDRRVSAEDVQRLRGVYDAFDRDDADVFVGLLAHDIEWRGPGPPPAPGAPPPHGPDGVRTCLDLLREHVAGGWGTPEEFLDVGGRVVVLGRFAGTARATGRDFETPSVDVWTCRDGVPTGLVHFVDTAIVLAAVR